MTINKTTIKYVMVRFEVVDTKLTESGQMMFPEDVFSRMSEAEIDSAILEKFNKIKAIKTRPAPVDPVASLQARITKEDEKSALIKTKLQGRIDTINNTKIKANG